MFGWFHGALWGWFGPGKAAAGAGHDSRTAGLVATGHEIPMSLFPSNGLARF